MLWIGAAVGFAAGAVVAALVIGFLIVRASTEDNPFGW